MQIPQFLMQQALCLEIQLKYFEYFKERKIKMEPPHLKKTLIFSFKSVTAGNTYCLLPTGVVCY